MLIADSFDTKRLNMQNSNNIRNQKSKLIFALVVFIVTFFRGYNIAINSLENASSFRFIASAVSCLFFLWVIVLLIVKLRRLRN